MPRGARTGPWFEHRSQQPRARAGGGRAARRRPRYADGVRQPRRRAVQLRHPAAVAEGLRTGGGCADRGVPARTGIRGRLHARVRSTHARGRRQTDTPMSTLTAQTYRSPDLPMPASLAATGLRLDMVVQRRVKTLHMTAMATGTETRRLERGRHRKIGRAETR